jgi:hypothetical protein
MGKRLYAAEKDGGIQFVSKRKAWEVGIPVYVYDLWLPVLGAKIFGIYSVYCRLEREGEVKGITLDRLAAVLGISKTTLKEANQTLQDFGFIRVRPPEGADRLKHWTTAFEVLDPPQKLPAGLPAPLCPWLVGASEIELPEVLPSTSGSTNEYHDEVLDGTSMIESSCLNPIGGETLEEIEGIAAVETPEQDETLVPPADYLPDVVERIQRGEDGKNGVMVPEDDSLRWLHYRDAAVAAYHELTGCYPDKTIQEKLISDIAALPDFNLALWRDVVTAYIAVGWNRRNVKGMVDFYSRKEIPGTYGQPLPEKQKERITMEWKS